MITCEKCRNAPDAIFDQKTLEEIEHIETFERLREVALSAKDNLRHKAKEPLFSYALGDKVDCQSCGTGHKEGLGVLTPCELRYRMGHNCCDHRFAEGSPFWLGEVLEQWRENRNDDPTALRRESARQTVSRRLDPVAKDLGMTGAQAREILGWIALYQPVNREDSALLQFLAQQRYAPLRS